jgi:protein TonB
VEFVNPTAAPIEPPKEIKPEPPPMIKSMVGGIPKNLPAAGNVGIAAPPPPPAPVRVGGDIKPPTKVKDAKPVYPAIARAARMSGIVFLEAIIAKDGSVKDLRVTRSAGVLDQAAIDAVSQWKYTPTLLNNEPVEVIMTVTVNFTLQ